jgi:HK97 family phage major capsid protein
MMSKELTMKELVELITESVKGVMKEMGIGQAEIKAGVIPQETKEQEDKFEKMTPAEKFQTFVKSVVLKDDVVVKALGGTTGPEGGYLIPTEFKKKLVETIEKVGIIRPLATVMPVKERTGTIPALTGKPNFSWDAENTPFTESDPVFSQIAYSLHRLDVFVAVSKELLSDTPLNLEKILKKLFAESYAKAEDIAFSEGDGSSVPVVGLGKVNLGANTIVLDSQLTYDILVDAIQTLKQPYREKAVIMTSPRGVAVLRKLKDSTGRPLLDTVTSVNMPSVMGMKLVENPYLEDTLVDPDGSPDSGDEYYTSKIIIGDMSYAYIFDRGEFGIEATAEGEAFRYNQVWFKAYNRIDFKVVVPEAFVRIEGAY